MVKLRMRDSAVLVRLAKGGLIVDQIHRSIDAKTPQGRRLFSGGNLAQFRGRYARELDNKGYPRADPSRAYKRR
jgi:hypothetical protein